MTCRQGEACEGKVGTGVLLPGTDHQVGAWDRVSLSPWKEPAPELQQGEVKRAIGARLAAGGWEHCADLQQGAL